MQRAILSAALLAARLYYRPTRLGSRDPGGPLLIAANHPNGLVDPVFLATAVDRPVRFLGKAPLFELPVLGALVRGARTLPIHRPADGADPLRNEETFAAVHAALAAGEAICVFPEGKSHSEPRVLELRTGTARMALGAEAARGFSLGVRVLPVGLIYRAKRRFQSEVAVWVGRPIEVRPLEEHWRRNPHEAVRELTRRIARGLRSVNLELERWDDLALLELADRILARDAGVRWPRLRAMARGLRRLRASEPERAAALVERVEELRARLDELGVGVHELDRRYPPRRVLSWLAREVPVVLLGLPPALVGTLFWWPPWRLVPWITRRVGPSRSIFATVQILAGAVVLPAWLAAAAAVVGRVAGPLSALSSAAAAVLLGLFALRFQERWRRAAADLGSFLLGTLAGGLRADLVAERDALAREMVALAAGEAERTSSPPGVERS